MKIPENWKNITESSHKTNPLNTMSLLGISFLWAHFLGLISLWWLPVTVLSLLSAYGTEVVPRKI